MHTYRNDAVQADIAHHLGLDAATAGERFGQMLLFLDRIATGPASSPTFEVDVAWHRFILHTRHYTNYCLERFGYYVHHDPGVEPTAPGLADCISSIGESSDAPADVVSARSR